MFRSYCGDVGEYDGEGVFIGEIGASTGDWGEDEIPGEELYTGDTGREEVVLEDMEGDRTVRRRRFVGGCGLLERVSDRVI